MKRKNSLQNTLVTAVVLAGLLASVDASALLLPGDFNGDGILSGEDVDPLTTEIVAGTNDPLFDLTADGLVTLPDLDELLSLLGSPRGDINFDGELNFADLVGIKVNLGLSTSLYTSGDVTADGIVDCNDLAVLQAVFPGQGCDASDAGGGGAGGAGSAVPAPATLALFSLGLTGLLFSRRAA